MIDFVKSILSGLGWAISETFGPEGWWKANTGLAKVGLVFGWACLAALIGSIVSQLLR